MGESLVLVVEDSAADQALIRRWLGEAHPLCIAGSVAEARRLADQLRPACILMDNVLPDARAADVLDEFVGIAPVVLMTGMVEVHGVVSAIQAGALNYLEKGSMTQATLRLAVNAGLEQHARRQAEAALESSRAHREAILEAGPDQYLVMDSGMRITELWPIGSVWPFPQRHHLGTSVPAASRPEVENAFRQAADGQRPAGIEIHAGQRVYELVLRPLPDGAVAVLRDITARRDLQRRVEAGLRMEALGRLAGGVAHDINNLLMVISACTEERSVLDAEDAEAVAMAVERGRDLTSKLLAFSRTKQGTSRPFDLVAHLGEAKTLMGRMLGLHVGLHLDLGSDPVVVQGDPADWDQLLLNLVSNAGQAGASHVDVRLRVRDVAPTPVVGGTLLPGRYACLEIQDDGHGMAPDVLDRAFEPFFTTRSAHGGSGLGLATVWGIVDRSPDTWLQVSSIAGEGTRFSFFLRHGVQAPRPARPARDVPTPQIGRVLLVDDDPLLRRAVGRLLRRAGGDVVEADSGHHALELLDDSIDVVLTDQMMPGMLGTDLADEVAQRCDTPVVLMSGYSASQIPRDHHVLAKPFQMDAFYRVLESLQP